VVRLVKRVPRVKKENRVLLGLRASLEQLVCKVSRVKMVSRVNGVQLVYRALKAQLVYRV
jgi:hypothetical protein